MTFKDLLLATGVFVVTLLASEGPGPIGDRLTTYGIMLAALICIALAFRHRWPRAVLAITVAGFAAHIVIDGGSGPLAMGPAIAVYTMTLRFPRRTAWVYATLVALIVTVARIAFTASAWLAPAVLAPIAFIGMAVALGDALRSRRAYVAAVEERARRAEQTREEEAERRVMEERLHIARELHDVLAHHIALINVQAGVAAHLLVSSPEQARTALVHIRQAGRDALDELRTTVGLLRRPGSRDDLLIDIEPVPGLDRLADLVDSFTAAGLNLTWQIDGDPRPLPSHVDLAAFRIIQEALTNVSKHAPSAKATVWINYTVGEVILDVTDTGTGGPHSGTGHGLIGMRERALSLGGVFHAGPMNDGGFRVHAVLPTSRK